MPPRSRSQPPTSATSVASKTSKANGGGGTTSKPSSGRATASKPASATLKKPVSAGATTSKGRKKKADKKEEDNNNEDEAMAPLEEEDENVPPPEEADDDENMSDASAATAKSKTKTRGRSKTRSRPTSRAGTRAANGAAAAATAAAAEVNGAAPAKASKKRARSASISAGATAGKSPAKKARARKVIADENEDEENNNEGEAAAAAAPKKRGRPVAAPKEKEKKEREIKVIPPKRPKVVKAGINGLPEKDGALEGTRIKGKWSGFQYNPPSGRRGIFVFGNGDCGQFGLGTSELGEIKRPRLHQWFEQRIPPNKPGDKTFLDEDILETLSAEEKKIVTQGQFEQLEGAGIEEIECGGMHTLAVDGGGKVWSWGINDNAALGRLTVIPGPASSKQPSKAPEAADNDDDGSSPPAPASAIEPEMMETQPMPIQKIWSDYDSDQKVFIGSKGEANKEVIRKEEHEAKGHGHANGGVFDGERGKKGDFRATRVAAGDSVSLAISELGEVRAWGSFRASDGLIGFDGKPGSSQTQLYPIPYPSLSNQPISQICCGNDHVLALSTDGHVFAIGNGETGSLGRKIIQRRRVNGLTPERLGLKNITLVGAGSYHSFAVETNGTVWGWGLNSFHQTGVADSDGGWEDIIHAPTVVSALDPKKHGGAKVVQITGGDHHTLFLLSNGQVWGCGRNDEYEIGLPEDHPQILASHARKAEAKKQREEVAKEELEKIKEADKADGDEAAMMAHEYAAQHIPLPNDYIPLPCQLPFPKDEAGKETKIVQIASGTRHNLGIGADGSLWAWGLGLQCQLGLGEEDQAQSPTKVKSKQLDGWFCLKATTGGQHSMVIAVKKG